MNTCASPLAICRSFAPSAGARVARPAPAVQDGAPAAHHAGEEQRELRRDRQRARRPRSGRSARAPARRQQRQHERRLLREVRRQAPSAARDVPRARTSAISAPSDEDRREQIGARREPERGVEVLRREEHQRRRAARHGGAAARARAAAPRAAPRRPRAAPARAPRTAALPQPGAAEQPPDQHRQRPVELAAVLRRGRTRRTGCGAWRANARNRWSSPMKRRRSEERDADDEQQRRRRDSDRGAARGHGTRSPSPCGRPSLRRARGRPGVFTLKKLQPSGSSAASAGVVEPVGRARRRAARGPRSSPAAQARLDDGQQRRARSGRSSGSDRPRDARRHGVGLGRAIAQRREQRRRDERQIARQATTTASHRPPRVSAA